MTTNLPLNGKITVTCAYGEKNKRWRSGVHNGIDFIGSNDIYSTCDGVVSFVGFDPTGWGQYVSIKPNGSPTDRHIFGHMVKGSVKVKVGDKITRLTVIGTMGSSGNSTGKHLHFEIRRDNKPIDPTKYLGILNKRYTFDSADFSISEKAVTVNILVKNLTESEKNTLIAFAKTKGYEYEETKV